MTNKPLFGCFSECCSGMMLACCLAGCGNPHGTVKVSGTVSVDGAAPPGPGRVTFSVVEPGPGFPNRPAMGEFGTDGKYQATSFEDGDGLVPGSYKVKVECYQTPPNMEGMPVKSYIAAKYMNPQTSGYELTVEPGSKAIVFDVEVKK